MLPGVSRRESCSVVQAATKTVTKVFPFLDAQNLDTPPTQTTHPGVPLVLLLLIPIVPHIVSHADPSYLSAPGARRFKQEIEIMMQSPPQNYPPHTHPTMVPAAENQARALPAQQ